MVQFLAWNGVDRPPIVTVVSLPFSNGNPGVGDNLDVIRGGSNVGTVSIEAVQASRRRALVELVSGDLPDAGDVLRYNGNSDATVESMDHAPARRGDIVDMLDDGEHPGTKVVTGANWSDPVDYTSPGGVRPDFVIVDVAGYTAAEARVALANRLAQGILGWAGTPRRLPDIIGKALRIDYTDLPAAAIASLQANGRASAKPAQFVPFLRLKRGVTVADIENKITFNGRLPGELTTYLS